MLHVPLFVSAFSALLHVIEANNVRQGLASDTPKRVKAEYKDHVYKFNDNKGKVKGVSQRTEDKKDNSVIVEAIIELRDGAVECVFGIEAKKGASGNSGSAKPTGWVECEGDLRDGMLDDLKSLKKEMSENAEAMCGQFYKQCPPNFTYGMMDYLMLYIERKGELPKKWRKKINVSNNITC